MRPRFGRLTQVLAAVFVLTGVGAGIVGLNSGRQTTPGSADNGLILLVLGAAYALVGVGLWIESISAWWAGLALTSFVVIVDLILGIHDGGLVLWSAFLVLFVISAAQGRRSQTSQR
jgi:hypothetical protein